MYKLTVLLDALDYISLGSISLQLADEEKHMHYCAALTALSHRWKLFSHIDISIFIKHAKDND